MLTDGTRRCPSGRHSHTVCPSGNPSGNPSNHTLPQWQTFTHGVPLRQPLQPQHEIMYQTLLLFCSEGQKRKVSGVLAGNKAVLCTNRHPLYPQQCYVTVMWLDFWVSKYENVCCGPTEPCGHDLWTCFRHHKYSSFLRYFGVKVQ